jgi:hypothetical protein
LRRRRALRAIVSLLKTRSVAHAANHASHGAPALVVTLLGSAIGTSGQVTPRPSARTGEWPHDTADLRGTKYSPLDQIDSRNFNQLEVAWRFKTDSLGLCAAGVRARDERHTRMTRLTAGLKACSSVLARGLRSRSCSRPTAGRQARPISPAISRP